MAKTKIGSKFGSDEPEASQYDAEAGSGDVDQQFGVIYADAQDLFPSGIFTLRNVFPYSQDNVAFLVVNQHSRDSLSENNRQKLRHKWLAAESRWLKYIGNKVERESHKAQPYLKAVEADFQSFVTLTKDEPLSVEELLSDLYSSHDTAEVAEILLQLELKKIPHKAEPEFCAFLYQYILENRDADSQLIEVTLGSAIRKLIVLWKPTMSAKMPLSALLEVGHATTLPLKLQLEVLRTILLAYEDGVLIHQKDAMLIERVTYLANACVNDIIVNERPHGATALNALLLLVFMGNLALVEKLVTRLKSIWFVELFYDRLDEMRLNFPAGLPATEVEAFLNLIASYASKAH